METTLVDMAGDEQDQDTNTLYPVQQCDAAVSRLSALPHTPSLLSPKRLPTMPVWSAWVVMYAKPSNGLHIGLEQNTEHEWRTCEAENKMLQICWHTHKLSAPFAHTPPRAGVFLGIKLHHPCPPLLDHLRPPPIAISTTLFRNLRHRILKSLRNCGAFTDPIPVPQPRYLWYALHKMGVMLIMIVSRQYCYVVSRWQFFPN